MYKNIYASRHGMDPVCHDVSAFTIGNTLTETWRGVRVMRSYSSIDKSNFLCIFDYILHAPKLTAFYGSILMRDFDYFYVCVDKVVKRPEDPFPRICEGLCPWLKPERCEWDPVCQFVRLSVNAWFRPHWMHVFIFCFKYSMRKIYGPDTVSMSV